METIRSPTSEWLYNELGWFVSSWWPGVILCLTGSVMMNWGTNVMKMAINARLLLDPKDRKRLMQTPKWVVGFVLFAMGTILNFAAFKFAAQSLLSGLSSVQFISQLFFSKFVLKERVDILSYLGVLAIIIGSVLVVWFGTHETKNFGPVELAALYGRTPYVCYVMLTSTLSCLAWVWYERIKKRMKNARDEKGQEHFSMATPTAATQASRDTNMLAALFAFRAGIWGSYSVSLAKSLSMLLVQLFHPIPGHPNPLTNPVTYSIIIAFVASAAYRIIRLNQALRNFEPSIYVITMLNISWILFASLGGGLYFDEFAKWRVYPEGVAYGLGFLTIICGVVMLCPRETTPAVSSAEAIYDILEELEPEEGEKEGDDLIEEGSHDGSHSPGSYHGDAMSPELKHAHLGEDREALHDEDAIKLNGHGHNRAAPSAADNMDDDDDEPQPMAMRAKVASGNDEV
eukprot:CAMPEP_0184694544 /NCGR_PEP_ID=MMETSP0313-20130426/2454_1 /TAXON_ID=2792 /ORGANISM="Porphyridium aerugineum, Strain SAG 1380-2" /LENGTH=457 /DNA_ID=CAMNT_0027152841 /DNA_START=332 /DNA_END=1705 /DNA_ORIENTATION=+